MDFKNVATIKQVTWNEVREQVFKVNPILCTSIDELSPGAKFPLFLVRYPFGKIIFDKGKIQLPAANGAVEPIDSPYVSSSISSLLRRRPVPMTVMLKNTAEVFYEMPERVISLNLFGPGCLFGLWENLDPQQTHYVKWIWKVASGCRSVYMLPKITEVASHKELQKKYGVRSHIPRNLLDHWQIFVEVANSRKFEHEWHTEMLFFSDQWMNTAVKDPAWKHFHNMVLQEGWNQSSYWRNKVTFDIIWEIFTNQLVKNNIKPNHYFVSILKHLVMVGMGVLPASVAAGESNISAPITGLQEAYLNDYKLRDYVPTLFTPHILSSGDTFPTYYSLQQPALLETALTFRSMPSVYAAMPEIIFLMDQLRHEISQGEIKSENTPVDKFGQDVICDYFHSDVNGNDRAGDNRIKHTSKMPVEDGRLIAMPKGYGKRRFAEAGNFIRGCIRFSLKKHEK
jgi:hypothetical protein